MLRSLPAALATAVLLVPPAAAQTVEEIIARNVQARGGLDRIKSLRSLRMTGTMRMGPIEAPIRLEWKRPARLRMEFTFEGNTGVQAFDGKNGWSIAPFGGKKEAEPLIAEDLKDIEEQADIDGPLVDHEAKGHRVELLGKEKVEGGDAYKLKVTLKNGDVRYLWLDAVSYLDIRAESRRTIRGSEVDLESTIGDYKDVGGGLLLPHSIQNGPKGRPEKQHVTIEKVELNLTVDDARFAMPAGPARQP